MSNVIHLTTGGFAQVLDQSKPVLIDFWAPWCGPCRMQGPILDEVSTTVGANAIVAKVNVDEEPALAAQFGVQSIPTLVVLKDKKLTQRMVGLQRTESLVQALQAEFA